MTLSKKIAIAFLLVIPNTQAAQVHVAAKTQSESGFDSAAPHADNSAINDRDKYTHEFTADQQGRNRSDTELTRQIRREITREKDLSFYAHNVKIITMNGKVTLKGPVRSLKEEKIIVKKAQQIAGANQVLNEIDVVTK